MFFLKIFERSSYPNYPQDVLFYGQNGEIIPTEKECYLQALKEFGWEISGLEKYDEKQLKALCDVQGVHVVFDEEETMC